jgi:hypothetical protein
MGIRREKARKKERETAARDKARLQGLRKRRKQRYLKTQNEMIEILRPRKTRGGKRERLEPETF